MRFPPFRAACFNHRCYIYRKMTLIPESLNSVIIGNCEQVDVKMIAADERFTDVKKPFIISL